jgi:hypothetical protein
MKVSKRINVVVAMIIALLVTFSSVAVFADSSTSCTPTRVRAYKDRMDMRCQGINAWFVARRSSTDEAHLQQMMALVNSAIVSGKSMRIYYTGTSGSRTLTGTEIFR